MLAPAERVGCEPAPPDYEMDPAAYIDSVRSFFYDNADAVRVPTHAVKARMREEVEVSSVFAGEVCADPTDDTATPDDAFWAEEGFGQLMSLLVKVSSKAAEQGAGITAFGEIDEERRANIRRHMFGEYMEVCKLLALRDTPSKGLCRSPIFLYRDPEDIQRVIDRNEDLGRRNVIGALLHNPVSAEEVIEDCRDKIEAAKEQFPTISHAAIRSRVINAPKGYQASLRAYAEQHGIVLSPEEHEAPDAETFLHMFRQMLRGRSRGLRGLTLPEEVAEAARELGEEAIAVADPKSDYVDPAHAASYDDPKAKQAFRQKIELLIAAADDAWRHGDLPVSPKQMPLEFRRALYNKVLGDFLRIHVALGERSASHNRVLYYEPAEVESILADNPDIPPFYFRRTLPTDPSKAEEFVAAFRARVEKIRHANPRLRKREAMHQALVSPHQKATGDTLDHADKPTPAELIDSIRSYLSDGARVNSALSTEAKAEISERLEEIEACFEKVDWRFGEMQIPEEHRPVLIKKVKGFIVASQRAYRNGAISVTLEDYDHEERAAIYETIAENYSRIVTILGSTVTKAWQSNPTLYMDADRLAELRAEHDWLSDRDFQEIVVQDLGDVATMLERALRTHAEIKRLHPGLGDSVINNLITSSPAKARQNAMAHVRKTSENQYTRYGSVKEPKVTNPIQVYRYYRTLIRYGQMPPPDRFDEKTEARIARALARVSDWARSHEGMADIEEETIGKFLGHIEYCFRTSEVLKIEGVGPSMLDQSKTAQARIVRAIYENQVDLNQLVEETSNGNGTKFRFYAFGFAHEAKYLKALWKQYEPYMPRGLVTLVALTSPNRPFERLNDLVEYRAQLLADDPGRDDDEIIQLLREKINGS